MKKKVFSFLLCMIVFLKFFTINYVTAAEIIQVTPDFSEQDYLESRIDNTVFDWGNPTFFYNYISTTSIGFDIFGNEAECGLIVDGYSEVTKISAYIYLQRYVTGKWTTIAGGTFHKEVNSNDLFFSPTKTLTTIGTYRFTTQIFVYTKDGSVELIEHASNTAVY